MMALRQDVWLWRDPTRIAGVLPVGLASQAAYSGLAAIVMWTLVRVAWPHELERLERTPGEREPHA
jgi:hypothetical protein